MTNNVYRKDRTMRIIITGNQRWFFLVLTQNLLFDLLFKIKRPENPVFGGCA
jgi:hypothetical protein